MNTTMKDSEEYKLVKSIIEAAKQRGDKFYFHPAQARDAKEYGLWDDGVCIEYKPLPRMPKA